ncbi:hypothetical protein E2C01_020625 [Portunus trituberculatus]|uniref:Uncharacterized protein n=1 Tax=Portunus trituberculatus TaxID=210409 RepID=A0A5B7E216_PORTR|nr:hypothetical protein [Portunus trituberculatus]
MTEKMHSHNTTTTTITPTVLPSSLACRCVEVASPFPHLPSSHQTVVDGSKTPSFPPNTTSTPLTVLCIPFCMCT